MSFEKFVQRSTKGLFLFIAIAMVLPLVLWGYMGGNPTDTKGQEVVATIFETHPVLKAELGRMRSRATVDWWWKQYQDPFVRMRYRRPAAPKADEVEKLAWENIVLLQDARMKGISATQKEVDACLREMYQMLTRGQDTKGADEILAGVVREAFHSDLATFDDWIGDHVVIEKLLNTVAEGAFESYDEIYSQMSKDQVLARAWVAGIDPAAFEKKARPSTADEIARRYEAAKARYKMPAKAQVTYLMADLEAFKKGAAEPSDGDLRKYYDDRKGDFALPHDHEPGEEHKPGEAVKHKPFEQVKGEVADKIKTEKAQEAAREVMTKVDRALGELFDGKGYPPDAFEKLKNQFKEQGLVFDVLPKFAARDADALDAAIGTGHGLGTWAFDEAKTQKGSVSRLTTTSKGVFLFRLLERQGSYDMGVTERVRESLERDLHKEQVRQQTSKAATNLSQAITTRGMEAARRTSTATWNVTRYFKTRGGDTGIEDRALGQAVANQATSLKPGLAAVLAGSQAGKPDWSYVVYLEDVVPAPETAEADFEAMRTRLNEQKQEKFKQDYPTIMVESAKIRMSGGSVAPPAP